MIKIVNLDFSYNDKKLFDNFNINIELSKDVRKYSIIGPNGCGKSTLLSLISGHLKPNNGYIELMGNKLKDLSIKEIAKQLSMIKQNSNFDFPFTCFETVLMGRYPFINEFDDFKEEDTEIALQAMYEVDIYDLVDKPITQVSGGEFQRVLLAKVLTQRPKIILLDEAFSAMDINYKQKSLEILKDYVEKNDAYLIMVIHDINLAYKYSDKTIIMKNGDVIYHGYTKKELNIHSIKEIFEISVTHIKDKGFLID